MLYEYVEQAKLLSEKISGVLEEELKWALEEGRLKNIPEESFGSVVEVVKSYYLDYNQPYGRRCNKG